MRHLKIFFYFYIFFTSAISLLGQKIIEEVRVQEQQVGIPGWKWEAFNYSTVVGDSIYVGTGNTGHIFKAKINDNGNNYQFFDLGRVDPSQINQVDISAMTNLNGKIYGAAGPNSSLWKYNPQIGKFTASHRCNFAGFIYGGDPIYVNGTNRIIFSVLSTSNNNERVIDWNIDTDSLTVISDPNHTGYYTKSMCAIKFSATSQIPQDYYKVFMTTEYDKILIYNSLTGIFSVLNTNGIIYKNIVKDVNNSDSIYLLGQDYIAKLNVTNQQIISSSISINDDVNPSYRNCFNNGYIYTNYEKINTTSYAVDTFSNNWMWSYSLTYNNGKIWGCKRWNEQDNGTIWYLDTNNNNKSTFPINDPNQINPPWANRELTSIAGYQGKIITSHAFYGADQIYMSPTEYWKFRDSNVHQLDAMFIDTRHTPHRLYAGAYSEPWLKIVENSNNNFFADDGSYIFNEISFNANNKQSRIPAIAPIYGTANNDEVVFATGVSADGDGWGDGSHSKLYKINQYNTYTALGEIRNDGDNGTAITELSVGLKNNFVLVYGTIKTPNSKGYFVKKYTHIPIPDEVKNIKNPSSIETVQIPYTVNSIDGWAEGGGILVYNNKLYITRYNKIHIYNTLPETNAQMHDTLKSQGISIGSNSNAYIRQIIIGNDALIYGRIEYFDPKYSAVFTFNPTNLAVVIYNLPSEPFVYSSPIVLNISRDYGNEHNSDIYIATKAGFVFKLKNLLDEGQRTEKINSEYTINDFSLNQNYPNPFNPTSTIKYDLPEDSRVQLKIFDILGKEVAELVNEEKPAGRYEVEFNASALASGIYFYRIQAGSFVDTKKMILMR